ncbi:putative membrane protein YlmG [Paenibacillus sp. J31TS4]|uniref:YggT family protein n=1 Tax=Paenibacillus sp. J31TS4 TaxID=2807195 RepID=UPI001B0A846A|nr:YggT family protein [Paenibacillus sp. J31TS4]GIP39692.1 putative membrane protein YlmG [Paenibacillus sp. J31TS4]
MDLFAIEKFITTLGSIYTYVIIAYVLLSWLPNARESIVGVWLSKLVEPYLSPFRKLIPPIGGMLDLSPIIALIALNFVVQGIIAIIEVLFGMAS